MNTLTNRQKNVVTSGVAGVLNHTVRGAVKAVAEDLDIDMATDQLDIAPFIAGWAYGFSSFLDGLPPETRQKAWEGFKEAFEAAEGERTMRVAWDAAQRKGKPS